MTKSTLTRRQLLQAATLAMMATPHRVLQAGTTTMKSRIADIIQEYAAQGIHRTGTDVDHASANWLAERISALGIEPSLTSFPFRRLVIRQASFSIDGLDIPGIPLFDGGLTDPGGVSGSLGPVGSEADIGVIMSLPYLATPEGQAIEEARRNNRHKAMVIVTDARLPANGIALINAEHFNEPFGPPVLQVANRYQDEIFRAVQAGGNGQVVAHGKHIDARASNVGATIRGRDPSLPPLVVMTPRSGWWRCASERGGGIAAFLEIMKAIRETGTARNVIFTANTGHELGHVGLGHYLDQHPGLVREALAWIHLGANFAARILPGVRLQYSDTKLREMLAPIMERQQAEAVSETPVGEVPLGEARNIHEGGGRYVSILGQNGLFHHPDDVWPSAVDLEVTEKWVKVLGTLAIALTQKDPKQP